MRWGRVPPTAPTASRWRGSPVCPARSSPVRRKSWRCSSKANAGVAATVLVDDLPLFSAAMAEPQHPAAAAGPSALEARLAAVRADELTPRQALELIYELKAMLGQGSG